MKRIAAIAALLSILAVGCTQTNKSLSTSDLTSQTRATATATPENSSVETQFKSPLPAPTGYVNDFAKVIDAPAKERLERAMKKLDERSQIQFAVATVETTGEQSVFDYSMAVARGWGVGPKDKSKGGGLLLLVSVKDKKWHIQVSRSLEQDLPDDAVREYGQLMNDSFRQARYGESIIKCVDAIIARLAERRGFEKFSVGS